MDCLAQSIKASHLIQSWCSSTEIQKLLIAIKDMKTLLRESTLRPIKCKELISGWTNYVGVKYSSGHGVGGVVFGENLPCTPTVFCIQWPEWVKVEITSSSNHTGTLTNSDLEMAGLLLLWLVMEEVCELKYGYHVSVFSNNQPPVSWVNQFASKRSLVAGQLLRAMALGFKMKGASPLTSFHIVEKQNAMMDIPLRFFW